MKRIALNVLSLSVAVLTMAVLSCGTVWAQATAQISGTVTDQTGAVLPGVEVTGTQTDTGLGRSAVTNETGSYVLPILALGPYRLEVTLPGFQTYVQTGIVLEVNANPVIDVVLQVGQVAQTIEVQADTVLVETRNQGVSELMENTRILELPLNGRNVNELILLSGAAVGGSENVGITRNRFNQGGGVSIAGGLATAVHFVLDGATHNNPTNNFELPLPFPDAMQEFKVETSALGAQHGVHSAGAVNAVTKSGTNEFHGNVFEFVRNYKFNARNAFAVRRDTLKRNQFGGTISGPIMPNRMFFFAGYQGTYVRQDPAATTSTIPTPAMLDGDFTTIASSACNRGRQIRLRGGFVGNRIDPALLSPAAVEIASRLPTTNDPCGRYLWGARLIQDGHQVVSRIDYSVNERHSIFGRYMATSLVEPSPFSQTGEVLSAATVGTDNLAQAFTFGDTYLFGSNVVNSFRLSANRAAAQRTGTAFFDVTDVGVDSYTYIDDFMNMIIVGGPRLGGFNAPTGKNNTAVFAINDDVSWVTGNHQLAFGGSAALWDYNYGNFAFASGGLHIFTPQHTGMGLADFLTGQVGTLRIAPPNAQRSRQKHLGMYLQDTWRATPRVTVNAGVRWEPFFPQARLDGSTNYFDFEAFQRGEKTTQFKNAPPGLFYPGDPGFPGNTGSKRQWGNFSPRVGLAWDVNGDGRTSVRLSYGIFYDFPAMQWHINTGIAPPWEPRIELRSVSFDNPWADYEGGNPFPIQVDENVEFNKFATITTQRLDTKNPAVSQWNLSIQRQMSTDWLVSAAYLGSITAHLWTYQGLNNPIYFPGRFNATGTCTAGDFVLTGRAGSACSTTRNSNQRRPLLLQYPAAGGDGYGHLNLIDDGGTANYHGLRVSVQRRPATGVSLSANYTWSHCISDPVAFSSTNGNGSYLDDNNRRFDRGNCINSATDIRHVFNLSAVAETPQFANPTVRALASGWRLSPIVRLQSGRYLNVTTSTDVALNTIGTGSGSSGQRPNQVLPDVYGAKTVLDYLNPAAFALPATGTLGNLGRGAVLGLGTWQFDVALSKVVRIDETRQLEFRAEAFNVTNSLRMKTVETEFDDSRFGEVISALDPRVMQFALKYRF